MVTLVRSVDGDIGKIHCNGIYFDAHCSNAIFFKFNQLNFKINIL